MLTSFSIGFTKAQLKAKLLQDNDCLVNALFKLLDHEVALRGVTFLVSLREQVIWRRRDHERGLHRDKPLLSEKQFLCLRRSLTETYLDTLYEIAAQRLQVPQAEPAGSDTDCSAGEWDTETDAVSQSWFCTVCDGLAVIEHCGLRYCRAHYDEKRSAEASVDPYDLRNLNSLSEGEEGR